MAQDFFSDMEDQEALFEDGLFEDGLYEDGLYEDGLYEDNLYEDGLYETGLYEDSLYEDEPEFEDYEFDGMNDELYEDGLYEDDLYSDGLFEDGLYEGDYEADPFLGKLVRKAGRFIKRGVKAIAKNPVFKNLARTAAGVLGGVVGGPAGAAIGTAIASSVIKESEYESEAEAENELYESDMEFEDMGGNHEAFAEMENAAVIASQTTNEMEASRQIARMVRQTPRLIKPRRNPQMRAAYPKLMRASAAVAKTLSANPKTRWAVRLLPVAVRRTVQQLASQKKITNQLIIQVFSRNVAWVLANRRRASATLRQQNTRRRSPRKAQMRRRRPAM